MNLVDLSGKSILVGVSGSIAAYKACELVRLFVKSGADVKVVMSDGATKFVSPLTFEALTRNKVLTSSSEDWASNLNHIDYPQKSDAFVIAPATANTINKIAKGIADSILTQCALAYQKDLIIAPAANTVMLHNHYTEGSLKMLAVNDIEIVKPVTKTLACGDEGDGALAKPLDIYYTTLKSILKSDFWSDRRVVVTGGGTREAIDSVRFIGNHSSGKMANALSLALYLRGADVCLITTKRDESMPSDLYTLEVDDAQDMYEYTVDAIRVAKKGKMSRASMNSSDAMHIIQKKPYLFMAAAVADYRVKFPQDGKLKKSQIGEEWNLELVENLDILKSLNKDGIISIGFKAEKDKKIALESAKSMLESKEIDGVCLNILGADNNFGSDLNKITCITKKSQKEIPLKDKLSVSFDILDFAQELE